MKNSFLEQTVYNGLLATSRRLAHFSNRFSPDKTQAERVKPWHAIHGDKTLRLRYDLNHKSVVFDLGGYEGQWASDIYGMYQSRIFIFEPYPEYYENIVKRFKHNQDIDVFKFGLSSKDENISLSADADASSVYKKSDQGVTGKLKNVDDFLNVNKISHIHLMKINIEGGEYDLLENLISTGRIANIDNLQIQFHDFVPDAEMRMKKIQQGLKKTHKVTYQYPFVWENWQIKKA